MEKHQQEAEEYGGRTVPPATPPTINRNASAEDAATRPDEDGDSDFPGQNPDEIVPGQGDTDVPERTPDEVAPDQGDFDRPDSSPIEMPPQPDTMPAETPPPD